MARKRIVPRAQQAELLANEYLKHFIESPLWLQGQFEPVREHWKSATGLEDYPPTTRVSWINPGGQEVRATWHTITSRVGLYQDLRVHPYDLKEE